MPPRKYEILHMGENIHTFYSQTELKKKLMDYKRYGNSIYNIEDMHVKETSFATMQSISYSAKNVISESNW